MSTMNFFDLMSVSPIMPVILITSIVLVAYLIERSWYYHRAGRISGKFIVEVKHYVKSGRIKEAIKFCEQNSGLLPQIVKSGLESSHLSRSDAEETMETYKIRSQNLLKKRLPIFGTLSFISPLLGLLGTVMGIARAFRDVALSGSGGATIIAAGVSEALYTTMAGIIVAIPAAIAYNYFTNRLQNIMVRIDTFTQELSIMLYSERIFERRKP